MEGVFLRWNDLLRGFVVWDLLWGGGISGREVRDLTGLGEGETEIEASGLFKVVGSECVVDRIDSGWDRPAEKTDPLLIA